MRRKRFSKAAYASILEAQGGKCTICGDEISCIEECDRDHIIPLAAGGKDEPDNIQIVHRHCHKEKTRNDSKVIAKIRRIRKGGNKRRGRPIPGTKASGWKCYLTCNGKRWERRK